MLARNTISISSPSIWYMWLHPISLMQLCARCHLKWKPDSRFLPYLCSSGCNFPPFLMQHLFNERTSASRKMLLAGCFNSRREQKHAVLLHQATVRTVFVCWFGRCTALRSGASDSVESLSGWLLEFFFLSFFPPSSLVTAITKWITCGLQG